MSKLIDSFPGWATEDGLFSVMYAQYGSDYPWLQYHSSLDKEYFGNHSGMKETAPIIDFFVSHHGADHDPELYEMERVILCQMLDKKFKNKWTRLYAVEQAQYEPIENYRMYEKETPDLTRKHSVSNDYAETDSKTLKRDITRTESATEDFEITDERKVNVDTTVQTDIDNTNSVYGFNSSSAVKANELDSGTTVHTTGLDTANKETNTRNQTGGMETHETADPDDNIETNTHTQTGYKEEHEGGKRELERSGNIGVTTSQQMLESEIALWQWTFIEQVYQDVDSVLTSPVYEMYDRGNLI